MRRRNLGLTLVETLVVLALVGLLVVLLFAILMPDDDRRCRIEAHRLTAFLTAASAESVMREAPVRVAFDLDRGTAAREFGGVSTGLDQTLWRADARADAFELSSPVRFDAIDSAASPDRTSGTGYLIFRGERTAGAAVVLELEQIHYTVLVPPNGGEIRVEKGRLGRPAGPPEHDVPLRLAGVDGKDGIDDTLGPMPFTGRIGTPAGPPNPAAAPPAATPSQSPPAPDPPVSADPPSNQNGDAVEPDGAGGGTGQGAGGGGDGIADGSGDVPPPPGEADEPEGALPEACITDAQCGPADGWAACDTAFGVCVVDPAGRALRMKNIRVVEPQVPTVTAFVESQLRAQILQGGLNLLAYFDANKVWLVQAERLGEQVAQGGSLIKRYRQVTSFPSYPGEVLGSDEYVCDEERRCRASFDLAEEEIHIYVWTGQNLPQTCNYNVLPLRVAVDVQATLTENLASVVSGEVTDEPPASFIRLNALLSAGAAREVDVPAQTGFQNLFELMQSFAPLATSPSALTGDINGDGQPDAWRFVLQGNAESVELLEPPVQDPNARPQFCL